jgi:hypothetical protein
MKGLRPLVALVIVAVASTGGRLVAHHAFASAYVEDRTVAVEADVVQLVYRNPHALLYVVARDASRQGQKWTVEWESRGALDHQGVTPITLKAGDRVVVTGNPSRDSGDHWMRALKIVRPRDGWRWSALGPMR